MVNLNIERIFSGIVSNKPKPLPGWTYIEREGHWLLVRSPFGSLYFVGENNFYPAGDIVLGD